MKLNTASEKAIAVIAYLSINKNDEKAKSEQIAERLALSDSYTKKILRKLVLAGIISANTGNAGGYQLALPTQEINLLMIIEAMEGTIRTFPEHGVLNKFFNDHSAIETVALAADDSLKEKILHADELWRQEIATITLASIIASINTSRI